MLNMFPSIYGIKNALVMSIKEILNILGVLLLVWLIFAIFGMNLYRNKLGFCEDQMNFKVSKKEVNNIYKY